VYYVVFCYQLDSDGVLLYAKHIWNKFVHCASIEDVDAQRKHLLDQVLSSGFKNCDVIITSPYWTLLF